MQQMRGEGKIAKIIGVLLSPFTKALFCRQQPQPDYCLSPIMAAAMRDRILSSMHKCSF